MLLSRFAYWRERLTSVGYDAGEGYFECLVDAVVCTVDGGSFCGVVQMEEEANSGVDCGDREREGREAVRIWRDSRE
jgi:hypothetical protein